MLQTKLASAEQLQEQVRFRQFLKWYTIALFGFALVYGLLFGITQHVLAGAIALDSFVLGCVSLIGQNQLTKGHLQRAVFLTVMGLFAGDLLVVLLQPALFPPLTLVPLLAVTLALPYLQGREMRLLLFACVIVTMIVVILGVSVDLFRFAPLPYNNVLMIGIFIATVALICLLLWQFTNRLNETIVRVRAEARRAEEAHRETTRAKAEIERQGRGQQEERERLEHAVADYLEFVQEVGAGNLEQQLEIGYQGALGQLGTGLNDMVRSLSQALLERQQLQDSEIQNRQRLEQAVSDYLEFVERIAGGDLSGRMQVQHEGALGQLGQGLNKMASSLQRITSELQEAVANISSAAAEILAATTQQAASAAEQSAAISQTTTTIEEVKVIATQTASQATQVALESQEMLHVARQGTYAVEETVGGMGQIRERVESIAETILALSEQTQAIGMINATVNELADQSNLLALNAAIEAARAGEQGKSFAVVAQQVRSLAERSKVATRQVREIIGEIQESANAAVIVTEEGTKGVEAGVRLASQAGQVIQKIASEVELGAQSNVQMAAAAQQQTVGIEQISQAMLSIQQATMQTLTSTRQAEKAAQDLNALARSLERSLAAYRLA